MSFLEQLEAEARRQREQEESQAMAREEREIFFREIAEPTMRQLFNYLKKLIDHLNYLGGQTRHLSYQAPSYGQVKALLNNDLRVRYSAGDEHRQIDVVGTASIPRQREVELAGDVEVKRMQTFLRERGLTGNETLRRNSRGGVIGGAFRLSGNVSVRALIESRIDEPEIRIEFTNFDDFGRVTKVVPPEHMDESLMDKLGRFIAGVDREFLRENLSSEIRDNIRRKLQAERSKTVRDLATDERQREAELKDEKQKAEHAQQLSGRFKSRLENVKKKLSDI